MQQWEKSKEGEPPKVKPMKVNWNNFDGPWNSRDYESVDYDVPLLDPQRWKGKRQKDVSVFLPMFSFYSTRSSTVDYFVRGLDNA